MQHDPRSRRRARTRSLIQLGGLIEKSGLLQEFDLPLGADFQKDLDLKQPVSALMGALLMLKEELAAGDFSAALLAEKGLRHLAQSRPLMQNEDDLLHHDEAVENESS